MEIEIRAFIDDFEAFESRLKSIDAKLVSKKQILDFWFCKKEFNKFEQVQQHEPGSYALRIRRETNNGKTVSEFNCKVLEKEGDHNAFHEFETKIENYEQAKQILEAIGFKVFCTVDKKRKVYKLDHCLINLEDIKGLRPAVELEIIDDNDIDNHKSYLRGLLNRLGIKEEDKIEKSITYLYMKKFSFKK